MSASRRQLADAERILLKLIEGFPSYGRGFQELGHLYRDTLRNPEAVVPTPPPAT